jgi:tetratricopeptide (TPR) repeat protein
MAGKELLRGFKVVSKEFCEGYAPVLSLIAARLVSDPDWSLKLLEIATNQLLLPIYRQRRDASDDVAQAIEAGLEVVRRCPDAVADILALAQLLARAERLEEALLWVDRAIVLESNNAESHRLRASVLERLGRYKDAHDAAKRALSLNRKNHDLEKDVSRTLRKLISYRLGISRVFKKSFMNGGNCKKNYG